MAGKKAEINTQIDENPVAENAGGMIPGWVKVENLTPSSRDITLRDSTNLHLGPYGRGDHISNPLPKNNLPLYSKDGKPIAVGKMISRGEIRLIEEA